MVDLQPVSGIVSTCTLLLIVLYIVLSIALDWVHHPFGHKIYKRRK